MPRVLDHGFVKCIGIYGKESDITDAARVSTGSHGDEEKNRKLLRYLYKNGHTTPFEMVELKFHVKCPIFVARQWMRHRTWSYNEMSGRYRELPTDFYIPKEFRAQSVSNKQGSCGTIGWPGNVNELEDVYTIAVEFYNKLLGLGVCREQARIILPVGIYTEFIAKVDLHNLLHFLRLRCDEHAQWEMREYANAIRDGLRLYFPTVMECFDADK